MTASTHWLATGAAQSVLERGGNAFDAAVAAGFVLHIVEPHLNGAGGDMVALVAPASRRPEVVVGQGPAPAGASADHFAGQGLDHVPGAGALAAAVPGAVEAWLWMLEEHGSWEVADVLAYALHYAETGHEAGRQLCGVISTMASHFRDHWPTSADLWLRDGAAPEPGQVVTNHAYARTLRRLLEHAVGQTREHRVAAVGEAWRTGFVAEEVSSFVRTPHRHSSGTDHAGVIGAEDFARFSITTEEPVALPFRGRTVLKSSFWGQGPVLLQTLAILDHLDDDQVDPSTATGAHCVIEALKLAMADRDAYYGDGHDPAVLAQLLSPQYAAERARLIGDTASLELRPGTVEGLVPYRPPFELAAESSTVVGAGEPTVRPTGETRGDTCHVDVVDRWGNMVSATPSGGWLQSSPAVPSLGFALGTRLQMTWLDPSSPSALRPGTRPRTTLSPTMLLDRDGVATAALGTPGGDQQDQWQLLYLLRVLVGGYSPQEAIDAPMFHTTSITGSFWPRTWAPGGVVVEDRIGEDVIEGLRARGHVVTVSGGWSLGRLSTVTREPGTGRLGAAANSRGAQGYAAGR
ncbi:transferase [Aeromicrobium endophyticum]|uniref:Transferase n=2 Tax=Aeromicrobium endophyticum TaxID=2292704 RepID=A0A371PEG7_9ACTN|nr:transferase [Aeromicrobium endophyticum]